MSRHGRRGEDEHWRPGDYPPPDADDPFAPGDYGRPSRDWAPNPIATADTGDFPVAGRSLPPGRYPRDPGGRRAEDFDWGPDPLGLGARGSRDRGPGPRGPDPLGPDDRGPDPLDPGTRGRGRPGGQPEPMAPDRWAPQSWEPPSWERASWDSGTAGPAGRPGPPAASPDWAEHARPRGAAPGGFDDLEAGELPPLPPGPMPGSGHPSGPLPPLPESGYLWAEPGRAAGYPDDTPGYPGDGPGYPDDPGAYLPDREEPADYPVRRGRGRRGRSAEPEVGQGHPGYEGYVEDPRDLDMAPDQGQASADYAPPGWYPGGDEPHAWAEEDTGGGLLPGLRQSRGSRRGGDGPAGPARKRRRRGRTVLLVLLTVFIVFVAVVGGVGYHYYRTYINPPDFPGAGTASTAVVQIQPGQSASAVGATLASKGVVASARAFDNAAKASPQGNALEPGYYRVHLHMKASLALALLLKPSSRVQSKVTIPEGFRVSQIVALLGKQTGDLKGYQQAIAHPAALGLPAFAGGKPEGYLFPATYTIPPHTTPTAVLKMMVDKFQQNALGIGLPAKAAAAHETQAAVITVASIIEAEGKRPQDFPKIAEVIYNRLNANPQIKLELDTTVLYAMSLAHKNGFNLGFPSPYNTYRHAGLPPGPIDNPGNLAIQAALHPARGNFLFFLTTNSRTGATLFFSTGTAFNNAVAKYGSTGGGTGSRAGSG